jgi:hypothetical protein
MNIFILDSDPTIAASYMCDRHVVKMILETAQILCTVSGLRNIPGPYGMTHVHHPVVKWTNQTLSNWEWLCKHGIALCKEYTRRYHKRHKSQNVIEWVIECGARPPIGNLTPFVQAMPDKYKNTDAVIAYRDYYLGEKKEFATWHAPAQPPTWWFTRLES